MLIDDGSAEAGKKIIYSEDHSFGLLCHGKDRDALALTFEKQALQSLKAEQKAFFIEDESDSSDEQLRKVRKVYADYNTPGVYGTQQEASTHSGPNNVLIRMMGGIRYYDEDYPFFTRIGRMIDWQRRGVMQTLFANDPINFLKSMREDRYLLARYGSMEDWVFDTAVDGNDADNYVFDGAALGGSLGENINLNRSVLKFEGTNGFQHSAFFYDCQRFMNSTFNKSAFHPLYPTLKFNYFEDSHPRGVIVRYGEDHAHVNLQLNTVGRGIKIDTNEYVNMQRRSDRRRQVAAGAITDLFSKESKLNKDLSDAFAHLFSSSNNSKFRGIFSGALFLQMDDFTYFDDKFAVDYSGYLKFFETYIGSELLLSHFVITDLNQAARSRNMEHVKNTLHSIAKEFCFMHIHTGKMYLISIGEHRSMSSEKVRAMNSSNPRLEDSSAYTNDVVFRVTDINKFVNLVESVETAPLSSLVKHAHSSKPGRGIIPLVTSLEGGAGCAAGFFDAPLSPFNNDFSADDEESFQNGLEQEGIRTYIWARDYESQKTVEQAIIATELMSDMIALRGSLIRDVVSFNFNRIRYRVGSPLADPAALLIAQNNLKEVVANYHRVLWVTLHSSDTQRTVGHADYLALPQDLQDLIGIEINFNCELLTNHYNNVKYKMMEMVDSLDANMKSGNNYISQTIGFQNWGADRPMPTFRMPDVFRTETDEVTLLRHFVFFNLGDDWSFAPSRNGVPKLTDYQNPQTHPHLIPFNYDWEAPMRKEIAFEFASKSFNTDFAKQPSNDKRDSAESNPLLMMDITPLLFVKNTIESLPVLGFTTIPEEDKPILKEGSILGDAILAMNKVEKFGMIATPDMSRGHRQHRFNFRDPLNNDTATVSLLKILAAKNGVTNLNGETGKFINSINTQLFNSDGTDGADNSKIYFRLFCCAIHSDTGAIPCTTKILRQIIELNKAVIDLEFYHLTSFIPDRFSSASKNYIKDRVKKIVEPSIVRTPSLFLYENYK